jgi:hypothetical protein
MPLHVPGPPTCDSHPCSTSPIAVRVLLLGQRQAPPDTGRRHRNTSPFVVTKTRPRPHLFLPSPHGQRLGHFSPLNPLSLKTQQTLSIATHLCIVVLPIAKIAVFDRVREPSALYGRVLPSELRLRVVDLTPSMPWMFSTSTSYLDSCLKVSISHFEQVIRYHFFISCILAQLTSTKSRVYSNFEQECEYQIPS